MNAPFFVEILSRSMEVKSRHQHGSMPIRIGRAYNNDIILDDPHIAAYHVIVDRDGEDSFTIRDLGSLNGIFIDGNRQTESKINTATVFRLGHTYLRIRSTDCNVVDEIPVSSFHKWDGCLPAIVGITLIVSVTAFVSWIDDFNKFDLSSYFGNIAGVLLCGLIWCGIWALVSRLFAGEQTKFGRHLLIFGCGLTVISVIDCTCGIFAYALSLEILTRYRSHIDIAMVAGIVFFHLRQINPNNIRRFSIVCILLSLLGSATTLIYNYSGNKILADELFMYIRFPVALRISPDKPVSTFINDAGLLKSKLENEKAANEDDDGDDEKTAN